MKSAFKAGLMALSIIAGTALAQGVPGFGPGCGPEFEAGSAAGPGGRPGMGPGMMGGYGGGYGPGYGRAGRMGMMGGYGGGPFAGLNLTDDQRVKLLEVQEDQRRKMLKLRMESRDQLEAVLTPEQRKQLRQLGPWWLRGAEGFE